MSKVPRYEVEDLCPDMLRETRPLALVLEERLTKIASCGGRRLVSLTCVHPSGPRPQFLAVWELIDQ